MSEHPNVSRARAYLDTYNTGNIDDLEPYFTDDIVWRVGGSHPLSGTYEGKREVLDYFTKSKQMTGATLTLEPESILASDRHMAMFMKARAERDGTQLEANLAQVFVLAEDGRFRQYWALSDDQPALDRFWS